MTTLEFPLKDLEPGGALNSRTSGQKDGLDQLKASILAHGLLQPLVGCDGAINGDKEGKIRIIDGNRRLEAVTQLVKKKKLPADFLVPVRMINPADDLAALELSLAANTIRIDMHMADKVEAVARMIEGGKAPHDIADHFDESVAWVSRCIRLGKEVAPAIMKEWRDEKISTAQVEALSLEPDFERQVQIWKAAKKDRYMQEPVDLRRAIMRSGISASDKRVKFVTLEAYAEAGGFVRKDLFSDNAILTDEALLDSLVENRFIGMAVTLTGNGWKFAASETAFGFKHRHSLMQLDWRDWLTPEEATVIETSKEWRAKDEIEKAAKNRMVNDGEARSRSGVVMRLTYDGTIDCDYCIIHPDYVVSESDDGGEGQGGEISRASSAVEKVSEPPPRLPKAQLEGLSETLTVALSRTLASAPNLALAITCAALSCRSNDVIQLHTKPWSGIAKQHDLTFSKALALAQARTTEDNLNVLAEMVAILVDARDCNFAYRDKGNRDTLIASLSSDRLETELHEVFDAQIHFARAPASECVMAADEIGCRPAIKGLKKVAMAQVMTAEATKCGWLPPELRTVNYTGPKASGDPQDVEEAA